MDDEKILKDLNDHLTLSFYTDMTQDGLDKLIDYCKNNDLREKAWRLALTFSNYNFDYLKLAKYYIDVKDSWYLSELLHVVGEDKIKIYDVYNDVLKTDDQKFIAEVQEAFMWYFSAKDKDELKKIIDNCK